MKKYGFLALCLFPQTSALAENSNCMPMSDMANYLLREKKQAFTATSISNKGTVYQLYQSKKTKQWTIIEVSRGARTACEHMSGFDWTWAYSIE